ncbi:MAG: tRNA epoxyqueuosine(34) reductase QueG [Planctomycetes bacterium]|nr:tRNA epoxyqueuosine(34) reductase QueG [Planctomycetota bacterium]
MEPRESSRIVKSLAAWAGFERCGIGCPGPVRRREYIRAWLQSGWAGSMKYLHRNLDQRADSRSLLDDAKSIIALALVYGQPEPPFDGASGERGRVAKYAWGADYHGIIKERLHELAAAIEERVGKPFRYRACVDTAPLLEREVAETCGIGWIGKNTLVLNAELGSYFVLGFLITTLDLAPDEPVPGRCGTCTACLDACPTGALVGPHEMDASRCISYLTIEHRGSIPEELTPLMGDWVFGCDVCQAVCPYNRRTPITNEPRFGLRPPGPRPLLDDILSWTVEDHRERTRNSALERATLDMLQRNARIARQNIRRNELPRSPGTQT